MIIPLRQWIRGAQGHGSSGSRDQKLSQAYLAASLRIAVSLSDQICSVGELAEFGISDGLPPYDVDWAERVTVQLQASDAVSLSDQICSVGELAEFGISDGLPPCDVDWAERVTVQLASDNYQPDPLFDRYVSFSDEACYNNGNQASDEDQLLAMMDSIDAIDKLGSEGSYARSSNGHNQNNEFSRRSCSPSTSLFNVLSAKLSTDDNAASPYIVDGNPTREKLLHIHALGLVLYELFSGGEKPPQGLSSAAPNGTNQMNFAEGLDFNPEYHNSVGEMDGYEQYGPRSRKKSFNVGSNGMETSSSTDRFKAKGLPRSLCDLIFNMVDCISGDLRGNESYEKISDVTRDLQLMIEEPHIYLQDLDVDKATLTGLELKQAVFMRNAEYASLQCAYRRAASGSPELAIISGPSGTGKSWLAKRLGRFVTANKGMFLTGKFDQLHQSKPFSALASAFNDYCGRLTREEESNQARNVAFKLQMALGQDSFHLVKLIPNLTPILAYVGGCSEMSYQDCANGQKRLNFLLCQFIEVITSCLDVPLTLFLDDAQWADEASISVLNQILKTSNINRQFFFVVTHRDDEKNGHSIVKIMENVEDLGVTATTVKLDCMDMRTVNDMVSSMLCLSPRLVTSLSEIVYHKTKGNPLFFSQLMLSLNREGLLRVSLSRRRWVWDEEKIQSRSLPDDVASFFVGTISRLPLDVQSALWVLSCFGASADNDILGTLESRLSLKLLEPLDVAVAEGLVNKVDSTYHFCHDRIQEAAYEMMEKEDRCLHHSSYGFALVEPSLANGDVGMLFTAVNQINLGGPAAVVDDLLCSEIAKYNLIAGKKAIEMSDFAIAFFYFDNGMSFLPKHHWRDHYRLTLELFDLAAKCALIIGDATSLAILTDQVASHARCLEDKLNAFFISMKSLAYASQIAQSVERGLFILSQLGHDIPTTVSEENTKYSIKQVLLMLDALADEDLLNYRKMTDRKTLMAMRFLATLETVIQQVRPDLQPFVTVKMVQLTISQGMSPYSPVGLAYFGGMVARLDLRAGFRLLRLAKMLLPKTKSKEVAGEVIALTTCIQCYIEPLQSVFEIHTEGEAAAMIAGDVYFACSNRLFYCVAAFWSGMTLPLVEQTISKACSFMAEQGHSTTLFHLKPLQYTLKVLKGDVEDIADERLTTALVGNKNPHQLIVHYFQLMYLGLIFDQFDIMSEYTTKYFEIAKSQYMLLFFHSAHAYIASLASYRLYRESQNVMWEARAHKLHSIISAWAEQGSAWNFQHKSVLLDAERAYSEGNFEDAQVSYTKAVELATTHKYLNDEALACELAARFHFKICSLGTSLQYYTQAYTKYCEWGANSKANRLYQSIQQQFLAGMEDISNFATS